jgi:sugar lactone lactonase YvrE
MEAVMTRATLITAALTLTLFVPPALAQEQTVQEVWALEGFQAPESAAFDPDRNVLYVSNIAGEPTEKNEAGFVSRVSLAGEMLDAQWVTGLHAPKGLAVHNGTLYVTDIDRLVAIDIDAGEITATWEAEDAQFLNDPAVDSQGRVFVSDMATNALYMLEGDSFEIWLQDEALQHPNGVYVDNGRLIIAAWGQDLQPDFSTTVPGHLIAVDLETQAIEPVGSGEPIGNLDGVEPDGAGNWLVTDWIAGGLFRVRPDGSSEQLLDLNQGSADLEYIETERLVIIPMMMDGRVVAYELGEPR